MMFFADEAPDIWAKSGRKENENKRVKILNFM
jgi:hypothetical protein